MARRRRRSSAQLPLFADDLLTAATEPPAANASPGPAAEAPRPARKPRPPGGLSSADARAMVWLLARGESIAAIARQFRVSRQTVLRYTRNPMLIRELEEQEAQGKREP
jgi:DNA-binding NarL/FixJ family response regulator